MTPVEHTGARRVEARVFVVDDDPLVVKSLARRVSRLATHVEAFESGASAADAIRARPPELILTDLRMPGLDGHAVLAEARAARRDTQVVVLTGGDFDDGVGRALEAGAFYYLLKPIVHAAALDWLVLRALAMQRLVAGGVAALALLAAMAGDVAAAPPLALASPGGAQDVIEDEDVVTAASRFVQLRQEAPAAVSVVTARDIEAFGLRTLGEALATLPGFHLSDDRAYLYVGVRGVARPTDYNNRLLVLLDGRPTNTGLYGQSSVDLLFPMPMSMIERIEVIHGPGSTLHGTNALLAVVNVVPRSADALGAAEVSLRGDTRGGMRAGVSSGGRFTPDVAFAAGLETDHQLPRTLAIETGEGGAEMRPVRVHDAGDHASHRGLLRAEVGDFALTLSAAWRRRQIPNAPWGQIVGDTDPFNLDLDLAASLAWQRPVTSTLDVKARADVQRYRFHARYVYDQGGEGVPRPEPSWDEARDAWVGGEVQIDWHGVSWTRMVAGVESRFHFDVFQTYYDLHERIFRDRRRTGRAGAFVEDTLHLGGRVQIKAGGRLDWYSTFGAAFNPRGSVVVRVADGTWLKALAGTAFRAPNAYELYYHDGGRTQVPAAGLGPERVLTSEVVLEQTLPWKSDLVASLYYNRARDLIEVVPVPEGGPDAGLLQARNAAALQALGGEVRLATRGERLRGWLNYALQHVWSGDWSARATNSPRHIAAMGADVAVARDLLWLGGDVAYVDSRRTLGGASSGAALQINLHARARDVPLRGVDLRVDVYNLLDRADPSVVGPEIAGELSARDGITASFGAMARF